LKFFETWFLIKNRENKAPFCWRNERLKRQTTTGPGVGPEDIKHGYLDFAVLENLKIK